MGRAEPDSDAALLAAARSDPDAFTRFYDRYERAVVGYFLRSVRSSEVAADLTAEVFANVLAAAARYEPRAETAAGWVFTVAQNTLRKSVRRGQVEAAARRRLGAQPLELSEDTLARLERADGDRWVRELLAGLPAGEREAVRRRVLDDRSYPQIAHELRTSELAVRQRVSRGLSRLRKQIERSTT